MSLDGCSRFVIEGGKFMSVGGDQIVSIVQCSHHEDRIRTVLDQYQEIPVGKVYLKHKIVETSVKRPGSKEWRKLDARQTIHVARILSEDQDEEFLHIQYSGRDAEKACKLDLDIFSAVKDITYIQLFGYSNLNALPALIFYDALTPVSYIWERNRFSSVLYTYLSYQAAIVQGLDDTMLFNELWLDLRTGRLCRGPYVKNSSSIIYDFSDFQNIAPPQNEYHSRLTLQAYNDTKALFEYLSGVLSMSNLIHGIHCSGKVDLGWPSDINTKSNLSTLPGTIYHRISGEIIARYPEDGQSWYYEHLGLVSNVPETSRASMITKDDGSVRFTSFQSDIEGLERFELCYNLKASNNIAPVWLSQAHGIFSHLRVPKDEWAEYSTLSGFWLNIECVEERGAFPFREHISVDMPIYLFIQPIPSPCDDMTKWDTWLSGKMYYWSFDPSGAAEIPDVQRLHLGLPSFVTTIEVWHNWWDRDAYDVLEMLHRSRLFDPMSMELARLLGWTILDIVGGWCHSDSEEVEGSRDVDDIMDIDNCTLPFSTPELDLEVMIIDGAPLLAGELFRDDDMEVD